MQPSATKSKSKPRLLVVTSMFPRWRNDSEPGFVFDLCRRMSDSFDIRVIAPHARGAARREAMDRVEIYRYRYAPLVLQTLAYDGGIVPKLQRQRWKWLLVPLFLIAQYLAVRSMLRRWKPDLVHAHWIIPQGLVVIAAVGSRVPVVITSHGGDLFGLTGKWLTRLKVGVMQRSTKMTVVSSVMKDMVVEMGLAPEKVEVAPMGVDLVNRFVPEDNVLRSKNEILFVGRLAEKKGVRYLLDAAPKVFSEFPEAFITIVGFGPEEEALREKSQHLGISAKVHFVGPIPASDVVNFYRRATVFVAPFVEAESGDQEGLGLVLVEAIGCGCPIVTSRLPAVLDVVGDFPQVLIPPGDSEHMAAAIIAVLRDPTVSSEASARLRTYVQKNFDWTYVGLKYNSIFSEILK